MSPHFRRCGITLLLVILLTSCGPAPTSPTSTPPQPTSTAAATAVAPSTLLEAGRYYSDPSADMKISFLDVVGFQAAVNEESETLEITLHMRDIPETAPLGRAINVFEYFWLVFVYLDSSKTYPADIPGDYYFGLNTEMLDPTLAGSDGIRTPIPGTPVNVSINQLFEKKYVYNSSTGESIAALNAVADTDADTVTLSGNVPGIKSDARFSFDMTYYDGTKDRPDNFIPNDSPIFDAGLSYSDASGDMEISFLDVVGFQAAVNKELELLEVVLQMRDVPTTATRRQMRNVAEYSSRIAIFLDPSKSNTANAQADYYLILWTLATDPPSGQGQGQEILTPRPGEPETVPIDQLWDGKFINNNQGDYISNMEVVADTELNTITLKARIPGITSTAAFSFSTFAYPTAKDLPDSVISSETANLPTPLPFASQVVQTPVASSASGDTTQLTPVGTMRAYPGPEHYAGDVLTFEIQTDGSFGDETLDVSMILDDNPPTEVSATSNFMNLFVPLALDTTNLSGQHTVKFITADGRLNESYSFEVLPADQRPTNEEGAAWTVHETACCKLHYITQTAAARDIEFIAEHFQQAAEDFTTITGATIDPKLDVYILDRIWGNGGFGGGGELVISYTDRYYGPTMGGEGLETLARHEFSHAADIAAASVGDGIDFNYEGLAVYIAGGHYKPEPLDQRGAALYDLGHYVPVGQFLEQHELGYLYPAAMLTYIVETYGEDKLWEFFGADNETSDGQPLSLEAALQSTFGVSLQEFDQGFQGWLESNEPGEQLEDLRLTIELQNLRRQYQDTYAPPPYFLLAKAEDAAARPEYVPVVIREANTAPNTAVELIIAKGQQAILDGDYATAEELIRILNDIVSTGRFEDPLAKEYLDVVLALEEAGYETVSLDLRGDEATAEVTMEPPSLTSVELEKVDGTWQVKP